MDRPDLIPDIVGKLQHDYAFKKASGDKPALREGRCPDCGKKSLWTWAEAPWHVQCNHVGKCGWEASTKTLYPELFAEFNKRYPATPEDLLATAKAYLRYHRGFDPDQLAGWFSQGSYWHPHGDKGTATVRFPIAEGVYWEKLIEPVVIADEDGSKSKRTENFSGLFKGLWWQPPGMEIVDGDKIYWAEGIFDCIALFLAGKKAVAIMSCGTFPDKSLEAHRGKNVTWVLALDNDAAGRKFSLKHIQRLKDLGQDAGCVLPGESDIKTDWNDLWKQGRLEDAAAWKNYAYYGALHTAESREAKALTIYGHKGLTQFVFDFAHRTHAFELDLGKLAEAEKEAETNANTLNLRDEDDIHRYALERSSTIKEIATFAMEFRYVEKSESGSDGKVFIRFTFPNGAPPQNHGLSGSVIGNTTKFKAALQDDVHGALWTGKTAHLDMIYRGWFHKPPPVITSIDYLGYDRDAKAYLYHDFAVKDGEVIQLNKDDYFDLGKAGGRKSSSAIKLSLSQEIHTGWVADFQTAYGMKGLVALTFWFGTLFAEQVRDQYRSFPFLELYGEPGSGKSYLIEFLWKLCGRDHEGFDPNKSTSIGRSRLMTQVANLPVVLIEADRNEEGPHSRRFDWEELKTLYDGEIGRVTGVKNQGNDTRFPPFRGSLVIAQNAPVMASDAIMSRIIQLYFDRNHHTADGRAASDRLSRLDMAQVSGFVKAVVSQEAKILARFNSLAKQYEDQLIAGGKVKMVRIAKNHGQLMAMAKCLPLALPISEETVDALVKTIGGLAENRQQSLSSDHPLVQRFWDTFLYLDTLARPTETGETAIETDRMNHSRNLSTEIAIHLVSFMEECAKHHLEPFSTRDLREVLRTSKRFPFIDEKTVNSRLLSSSQRCWVFQRPGK